MAILKAASLWSLQVFRKEVPQVEHKARPPIVCSLVLEVWRRLPFPEQGFEMTFAV